MRYVGAKKTGNPQEYLITVIEYDKNWTFKLKSLAKGSWVLLNSGDVPVRVFPSKQTALFVLENLQIIDFEKFSAQGLCESA